MLVELLRDAEVLELLKLNFRRSPPFIEKDLACVLQDILKMETLRPILPDQVCEALSTRWAQTFTLPDGLSPGEKVRTIRSEEGFWIVEGLNHPGRFWRVPAFLLEVVANS